MVPTGIQESFHVVVGSWDSSDVSTMEEGLISCSAGKSGFLSCSDVDLGVCLVSNGKSGLNCVEEWNSALLSRCKRGFRPPVELNWGSGAFLEFRIGVSVLPSCCELILRVPFKSVQGNQALSRVDGELRVSQIVARPPVSI